MTNTANHMSSRLIVALTQLLTVLSLIAHAGLPGDVHAAGVSSSFLLVTDGANAADPFGPYLAEILRAEGVSTFDTADVTALNPTLLSSVGVLLLGPTTGLSADQIATLTTYVQGGGRLIAMRPPAPLASLFGVTASSGTTTDGYIRIAPSGLGSGFITAPLQIHAPADNYTLAGATSIAALSASATTTTSLAAVTLRPVGQGQAMLWAYDLARSVVFTRQGNPSRVGEHDGVPGYRTSDLYAGYVDLNTVPIPQADEQMRLLTKAILMLNPAPMPHLWYFPQDASAVLVLTGDAHGNPVPFFTNELASIRKYGGHITFYLSQAGQQGASDVAAWEQAGNGVGIHPYASPSPPTSAGCGTADGNGIGAGITNDQVGFQNTFGRAPSTTVRTHYTAWQCWSDAASIEAASGLQLDTNVYPWGPWLQKADGSWAHGYVNGSGLPMEMVDTTGHLIPMYQQATALVDEQLIAGVSASEENLTGAQAVDISRQLLDASLSGSSYAAIMMQLQVDYYAYGEVTRWAEGTMAYAQSQGIPIWSADEWLRFTRARANASFNALNWDGSHLTFTLSVPSGPDALPLMVPLVASTGRLATLTVDGASTAYSTRTVKGAQSAVISVSPGSHSIAATYTAITPSVRAVAPTRGPTAGGTTLTISGTDFDPLATVTVGGVSATDVQVSANGTSITAVTPAHAAGAVDVAVMNPGNRSIDVHNAFIFVPPPTITAVDPQSGSTAGGNSATVTGGGFQPGASVTVGGVSATGVTVSSDGTHITMVVPAHGAGSVIVEVMNPDGQHANLPAAYTYGSIAPLPKPSPGGPPGAASPSDLPAPRPAIASTQAGTSNPIPAHR